jgi:cholestenol delta-isomerase
MAGLQQTVRDAVNVTGAVHPFYPLEADIVGYLANEWSVLTLLGVFAAGWVVILGVTQILVTRHNPTLGTADRYAILWFVLSEWSLGYSWPNKR